MLLRLYICKCSMLSTFLFRRPCGSRLLNEFCRGLVSLKFALLGRVVHSRFLVSFFRLCLELKMRIEKYFKGDEEALPSILEAILQRKSAGKHEETDDELGDELQMQPIDDVKDAEFESDFEDLHETDEEIDNLYNARDIVMKRMVQDEYFNMDDKKWDDMVEEAVRHGYLMDTKECEQVLEDMVSWDKLLPGRFLFFGSEVLDIV